MRSAGSGSLRCSTAFTLPRSAYAELFAHARERDLIPFSTPFSADGVTFLAGLGVPLLKVAF